MKYKLITSDRKNGLQTSETSEDLINKQISNNGHRRWRKIPLNSERGYFTFEYNLLVTQSLLQLLAIVFILINIFLYFFFQKYSLSYIYLIELFLIQLFH